MFERIRVIIIKEFILMMRDPKMRFVLFVAPLFQMLIMSYAVTTDVKKVPTAVYDLDNTIESRALIREFAYSKYFVIKKYIYSEEDEKGIIDRSLVNTVVRVDHGFSRDINSRKTGNIQLIIDGTDSNTASIIISYANRITERYAARLNSRVNVMAGRGHGIPEVEMRSRSWFNDNLDSRKFYVPGIVALVVLITTFLLTAMAIVREKEVGTIEQLIVSPIRPLELILGKLIPFGIIGIIDVFLVTLLAILIFHVPLRGNIFLLFISSCLFLLTNLGLGLLISTGSKTQQEALISMFFVVQPMVLLSGFVFPIANMPKVIQVVTLINPLRYFLVIIRGIFLKASGINILWPPMLVLLFIGITVITLSSLRFKRNIG